MIQDHIYNDRFKYVDGVKKVMGANIVKHGDKMCCVHAGNIYLLYKVHRFTGIAGTVKLIISHVRLLMIVPYKNYRFSNNHQS